MSNRGQRFASTIFKRKNTRRATLIFVLVAVMIFTLMPVTGQAAAYKTATPTKITKTVNESGKLTFTWTAVSGADKYKLTLRNVTKGTTKSFTTTKTTYSVSSASALAVLTHGCSFTAYVTAQDTSANYLASSAKYLSSSIRYVSPKKIYISNDDLTINKGKTRKLRVTFDTGKKDVYSYNNSIQGGWSSSNTKVATVSSSGNVKAIGAGAATIKYKTVNGLTISSKITVPESDTITGSAYIDNGQHASWHQVLGTMSMRAGAANRLNGTVKSDYKMSKIYVYLYNPSGVRLSKYTKSVSDTSYNLTKISKNVSFSKLPKGKCLVWVRMTNTKGTATLYKEYVNVTGTPSASTKGKKIMETALTRQGDPYSQWLRGLSNYTDCSYLTLWSYKQVANVSLPATAADQYKYCVQKKKTVKSSALQPGDLVFWGGKANARYKGIWHTAVYMGNNMICHANGSVTAVSTIQKDKRYPLYYGRPY